MLRLWATTSPPNPIREPMAEAIPSLRNFSVKQRRTAPQLINEADEYRLVTGGLPSIYILPARPKV